MDIKISCPNCKQEYFIDESQFQLGQKAECAVCHHKFVIGDKCINTKAVNTKNEDIYNIDAVEENYSEVSVNDFKEQYEQLLQNRGISIKNRKKYILYISIFVFIFLLLSSLLLWFKNQCTKTELDIVFNVQNVTGMCIGETINMDDVDADSESNELYVKKYKSGSFMKFPICSVEITPISKTISGFTFIDRDFGRSSLNTKLDKKAEEVIDNIELKYNIELKKETKHTSFTYSDSYHESACFEGKKYVALISYFKDVDKPNAIGGLTTEDLYFRVSNKKLISLKFKEEEIKKKNERKDELKQKGYK